MSFEERITRMQADGKLSPEQARMMRESMAAVGGAISVAPARRKLPLGKTVIAAAVIMAGLLMFSGTGGAEQEIIQNVSETMNQIGGVGAMNKNIAALISIFVLVIPVVLVFMWVYNGIVAKEEDVVSAWAQVETNYQRRADLIPNLVSTVKGFAEHETQVLSAVTESRAQAMQMKANPDDPASVRALDAAQKALGMNIAKLMAVTENYPQLRSADNFLALQDQLEGTENRINTARMVFNAAVNDYNAAIRKMPGALVANMGDFHRKAYFEADEGSEKAVDVKF